MRRLYKTPGQHLTLGQVVELNRRLLEGYTHFKDEPRVQKLRADVLKYNRRVRDLGLRDHQVKLFKSSAVCIYSIALGSEGPEGRMEDTWLADIPCLPIAVMDYSRTSRYYIKFSYSHPGIYHIKEEGQRSVFQLFACKSICF